MRYETPAARIRAAERERDAARADADEMREAIETICEFLVERGGWSEIDGDGDEGSIIVQHISMLLTEAMADADRLAEALQEQAEIDCQCEEDYVCWYCVAQAALAAHDALVAKR